PGVRRRSGRGHPRLPRGRRIRQHLTQRRGGTLVATMAETTQPPTSLGWSTTGPSVGEVPALVLVWSRDEPARAAEVLLVPAAEPGAAWTFGRGEAPKGARALGLVRQRPGAQEPSGSLACPRISREQLRVSVAPDGVLVVENVGRCPLLHGGEEVSRVELL